MRLILLLLVTAMLLMRGAAVSHCAMWTEGHGDHAHHGHAHGEHAHSNRPHVHISWSRGKTCVAQGDRSPCCHHGAPVPCEHDIPLFVSDDDLPRLQAEAGPRLARCDASLFPEVDRPSLQATEPRIETGAAGPPVGLRSGLASRPHLLRV